MPTATTATSGAPLGTYPLTAWDIVYGNAKKKRDPELDQRRREFNNHYYLYKKHSIPIPDDVFVQLKGWRTLEKLRK